MKAKINYKSRKTIIIIAIAVILLIAAIGGTVAFIKGNDNAAAAMPEDGQTVSGENNGGSGSGNGDINTGDQSNDGQSELPPVIAGEDANTGDATNPDGNNGNVGNNGTAGNNGTTNNGGTGTTGGNAGGTVPNEDYTQTTVIPGRDNVLVEQNTEIGWNPLSIKALTETAKLNINKPELESNKLVYVNGEDITNLPVNTVAQKGEEITYVIKIQNKGNIDATSIHTYDMIPEGTELVENSISNDGTVNNGRIAWKTDIKAGETVNLTFKVKVAQDSVTLIENTAKVNGKDTDTTHTPVITTSKVAQVVVVDKNGVEKLEDRDVKVGETIRYTITLTNETEYAGTTTVTDNIPDGTTIVEGSITDDGILEDGTITWENVNVAANDDTTVSFDVTVNEDRKESIKNVALVGNTETEETETKVANITTTKSSEGSANPLHELDTITYTLTATNSGNGEGTVALSDEVPTGTTLVENSIKLDGNGSYTETQLNNGIEVTLKAGESKSLTFQVTINPFKDAEVHIKNEVAKQDETTITPGTDDKVEKEYVTVTANKEFVDNENADGLRPISVEFVLVKDGVETNQKATADDSNGWTIKFANLDKYSDEKQEIEYTVKEVNVNTNYNDSYTVTKNENNTTVKVVNTLKFEDILISKQATKVWDDNNNVNRPTSIELAIYANGVKVQSRIAKESNNWTVTFEGLNKYTAEGVEIVYTFDETVIPEGYLKTVNGNTITNALPRVEVTKTVTKINGNDASDADQNIVKENDIIEYQIRVKNTGAVKLTNVEVTDNLDVYLDANNPENTTNSIATIAELEAGAEETYTVYYKVIADDVNDVNKDLVNVATATGKYTDGNGNEKEVTDNGEVPVSPEERNDLIVEKSQTVNGEEVTADTKVVPGDTIEYTITVTNTGNTVLNNVEVTDSMLSNPNFVLTDLDGFTLKDGKLVIATLEIDETKVITATYTVQESDMKETESKIVNTATAKADKVPEKPSDVEVPTEAWKAEISTEKTSEGSANPLHELDIITYKLTATNNGNDDGSVVIADTVPEGTTLVPDSIRLEGSNKVYAETELNNGITVHLNAGESKTLTFQVKIMPFETDTVSIVNAEATQDGTPIPGTTDEVEKEYLEVTVNKTWVDNEVQAQRRPDFIRFELYADGEYTNKYYNMSTENDTDSYTFDKLSKYNSDEEPIEYTVQEKEINTGDLKFYNSSKAENDPTIDAEGNKTYHFTNTFTRPTDTTTMTITKQWEDNNDSANKRPDFVKLHLNDEEIELDIDDANSENGNIWSTEVTKPVYDENGEEIVYTLDEKEENIPQWYEKRVEGYTVINTFKAPTDERYDITITKVWNDNKNEANKRPESISVQLNKKDINGKIVSAQDTPVVLTGSLDADKWTTTVNVQRYDEKANLIEYSVFEAETGSIFYVKESEVGLTVTNKFVVPDDKADITIRKVWNDNNNTLKRTTVKFAITGNGGTTNVDLTSDDAILNDGNIWEKEVETLPKYDSLGNVIQYTFDEVNVPAGYIKELNGNEITNSLPGIKVTKTVEKVNDDNMTGVNQIAVKEGDVIEYKITVENLGTVALTNFKVTDNLNVYLDKANPDDTRKILEENGTLAVGETKTYTVYYKVTENDIKVAGQTLKNVATATGDYTDSNNNKNTITEDDDADVTIADAPGITIVKTQTVNGNAVTDNTRVKPGDVINYTITVTNTGNTVLKDVNVTDSMSGKDAFKIISGSLNIGTLGIAPNNVAVITARYTVQESDMKETETIIGNTATVTTSTTPKDSSTVEVKTEEWKAEIDVVKSSELIKKAGNTIADKAEYGDTIRYTITATNTGKKAGSIDVTDTIPTGTELKETNNYTNLTAEELAQLKTEEGLTKTLAVAGATEAGNGSTSIYFEVIVTAKPGESIVNTATLPDGTEKPDGGQDVEKKINVRTKTETPKITNSNVVIVLDVSGSMDKNVSNKDQTKRLAKAKEVVKGFINTINLPEDGNGSSISIVTFSGASWGNTSGTGYTNVLTVDADGNTIANTPTDATNLANSVDAVTANGGTCISGALIRAKEQVNALKAAKSENKNIVIFVGDGKPEGDAGNISREAKALKDIATVYAVGFTQDIDVLKNTVASSTDKYYTTSDDIDLSDIFTQIGSDITPSDPVGTVSNEGLIALDNIDTSKKVVLRVKTATATEFTPIEDYVQNISQIDEIEPGKYYLNLGKFNADDTIEIDYFVVEQGQ